MDISLLVDTECDSCSVEECQSYKSILSNATQMEYKLNNYIYRKYAPLKRTKVIARQRRRKEEINRLYFCHLCDKGYELIQHLNVHKRQKKHGKAMTQKEYDLCLNKSF